MKKVLTNIMLAVALVMASLAAGVTPALADDDGASTSISGNSLKVSPSAAKLTLDAGKVLEEDAGGCISYINEGCFIKVENPGTKTYRYKVYVTPYSVTGNNNELSFSEDEDNQTHTQLARWIDVRDNDGHYVDEAIFTIKPGETQTVYYRVTIPDDIPGGSQYAVLWTQIMAEENTSGGIQTVGQVGSVISGRSSSGTREQAEIYDFNMTRFALSGPLSASAKVKNTGNADFVVTYSYTAKSFFGKQLWSKEDKIAAYPHDEKEGEEIVYDLEMEWENPPMMGIFNVEFKVSGAGSEEVDRHVVVVMPIIAIILIILLLTILIVWIIIIIRKRKERKVRKLV